MALRNFVALNAQIRFSAMFFFLASAMP